MEKRNDNDALVAALAANPTEDELLETLEMVRVAPQDLNELLRRSADTSDLEEALGKTTAPQPK
ncbi:MAG: hypothetical protein ACOYOB_16430 [Myxococcota bacterium]